MDWSQFDVKGPAEQGAFCHFRDPRNGALLYDGEGDAAVAVGITLLGEDSDKVKAIERTSFDRRMEQQALTQKALTQAQLEADNLEKLCAAAKSWTGIPAEFTKCNPANAKRFFEKYPPFREQAWTFFRNRGNYPAPPPTN